jgi:hypothetical protein
MFKFFLSFQTESYRLIRLCFRKVIIVTNEDVLHDELTVNAYYNSEMRSFSISKLSKKGTLCENSPFNVGANRKKAALEGTILFL